MAGFGLLLAAGGTVLSTIAGVQTARTEAAALDANAAAKERRATEERAVASVRGERRYREAERLASLQQAEAAHSGGGTGGSVAEIVGETARRGLQNSREEVWMGEQRGRGLEDDAALDRYAARQKRKSIPLSAGTSLLTGFSQIGLKGGFGTSLSPTNSYNYRYG